jgi:hypothetical protein
LLRDQPQFADRCPWDKVKEHADGDDWAWLLRKQPQFADRCPWERLTGNDWATLLSEQPRFADRCPWEKLDVAVWSYSSYRRGGPLLVCQPQFADKCRCWDEISDEDAAELIRKQPKLRAHFPEARLRKLDELNKLRHPPGHPVVVDD